MPNYDNFGDRMKGYESSDRFIPLLPVIARIDGKRSSKWTKGLDRPYDFSFNQLMIEVTRELVKETHARIGYTQSDEITLVFYAEDYKSQLYLDGKEQKMVSILASIAAAFFNHKKDLFLPAHDGYGPARFDARVFNVPNLTEAARAVLWREQDATKNAVSMAAQHRFSHNSLEGLSENKCKNDSFKKPELTLMIILLALREVRLYNDARVKLPYLMRYLLVFQKKTDQLVQ